MTRAPRNDQPPTPTPTPRRARAPRQWHVEHIDTEPMTAQQYHHAVTTLAALIHHWTHQNHTPTGDASDDPGHAA